MTVWGETLRCLGVSFLSVCVCVVGYTCRRENVGDNGCCLMANTTTFHACSGCAEESGCCTTFEYCVSCCLRPDKVPPPPSLLHPLISKQTPSSRGFQVSSLGAFLTKAKSLLYSSVSDPFELCLARCRTSSVSVVHENAYVDDLFKYCHSAVDRPTASEDSQDHQGNLP